MHVNNGNGFIRETKLGRVIHQETISLDVTEKDVWKTYGVNINKFVKEDPAALYELRITFKPEYSDYDCVKPVIIPEKEKIISLVTHQLIPIGLIIGLMSIWKQKEMKK